MLQRIDFVGNANSYPLTIARGMRALGYDVHMHLLDDYYLNDPKNLYPEYSSSYPEWIHDWRPCNIPTICESARLDEVTKVLAKADALVVNSGAVALTYGETRPYFCLLTGTDLLTYCNGSFLFPEGITDIEDAMPQTPSLCLTWLERLLFIDMQRDAIREANGYSFFPRALLPSGKAMLESIGADATRQSSILVTDIARLAFTSAPLLRNGGNLRVLVAARCTWDKNANPYFTEQDYKGTDVFLHGAALAAHNGLPLQISLFRKGEHVEQTEALIHKLNLAQYCTWHEECPQYDFHKQIEQHDVTIDSLDISHIGMAAVDSFAIGRPVIARQPSHAPWGFDEPFPVCHAQHAAAVAHWLSKLFSEQDAYTARAKSARAFAEAYLSPEHAAKKIIAALQQPAPMRKNMPLTVIRRGMYTRIGTMRQKLEQQANTLENLGSYNYLRRYFFRATKDKLRAKFRVFVENLLR